MKAKCIKRLRGNFQVPADIGHPYHFKTQYNKGGIYEWRFLFADKNTYDLSTEDTVCMYAALPHYLPKETFLEHFEPVTSDQGE